MLLACRWDKDAAQMPLDGRRRWRMKEGRVDPSKDPPPVANQARRGLSTDVLGVTGNSVSKVPGDDRCHFGRHRSADGSQVLSSVS